MKSKFKLVYQGIDFEEAKRKSDIFWAESTPQQRMDGMKQLVGFELAKMGKTIDELRLYRSTAVIKRSKR